MTKKNFLKIFKINERKLKTTLATSLCKVESPEYEAFLGALESYRSTVRGMEYRYQKAFDCLGTTKRDLIKSAKKYLNDLDDSVVDYFSIARKKKIDFKKVEKDIPIIFEAFTDHIIKDIVNIEKYIK